MVFQDIIEYLRGSEFDMMVEEAIKQGYRQHISPSQASMRLTERIKDAVYEDELIFNY